MADGLYVAFEGPDGAGKSTTMKQVADRLQQDLQIHIQLTHQPGSTPLGDHLRKLVKTPKDVDPRITMDPFTRQVLYIADTLNYIRERLVPALKAGDVIFSDRYTLISAMVYGMAEGLTLDDIGRLHALVSSPKPDRLYVLTCPWQVGRARLQGREVGTDHFDNKAIDFFKRVEENYNSLLNADPDKMVLLNRVVDFAKIKYIDSSLPQHSIVDTIVEDLKREILSRPAPK
jgi:dTMP kinase